MSRRASLPGAEELFRRTAERPRTQERAEEQVDRSTKLQVASRTAAESADGKAVREARKAPKHDEKVTFYCTGADLMELERARLSLRSEHGMGVDRGRIVRAALAYVLEDFKARADDSILLRRLDEGE